MGEGVQSTPSPIKPSTLPRQDIMMCESSLLTGEGRVGAEHYRSRGNLFASNYDSGLVMFDKRIV
jgi:hypothetical protein